MLCAETLLYITFIDLMKAFNLVSRRGLFKLLEKIGCPPKLLRLVISFHNGMRGTVQFNGSFSASFPILSGVKQCCILTLTLFGILFTLVFSHAFRSSGNGVHLYTKSV